MPNFDDAVKVLQGAQARQLKLNAYREVLRPMRHDRVPDARWWDGLHPRQREELGARDNFFDESGNFRLRRSSYMDNSFLWGR